VLQGGDGTRGREIFFGRKAGCTACHTILGQGGKVGPDLSKIGQIRSGRDLLEAIVFPSATFARGYEPFAIKTKEGAVYDGLILRETAEALYMFTASERLERRIPKSSIEAIKEGKVSVMPQGLDQQITRPELGDLIAFLQGLK
jgi:putative heme-binding domain-containing protein